VALAKPRGLRPAECRRGRPQRRDSNPVSRLFNALQAGKVSLPLFSERRVRRWRCGRHRGETRGFGRTASYRQRSRFFPRFSIYQCFASRKISLRCNNENFLGTPKPPHLCKSERPVRRAPVYHILWLRGFRDHTISGPGFNLFKSLRRHFRATGQLRPSLTMAVSEPGALLPSGAELRPARSRNGNRVRPSARSSWG
jgi:hypothetical protein